MEYTVKITPEGDIYFLYNDDSPLRQIGDMQLKRASNVVWDEKCQGWKVKTLLPVPDTQDHTVDFNINQTFHQRSEAIDYEIKFLNEILAAGMPIEEMFEEI